MIIILKSILNEYGIYILSNIYLYYIVNNIFNAVIDFMILITSLFLIAFEFFEDPNMQSFYRRFVRDYMRYKDEIHCAGAEIVAAVRESAKKLNPMNKNGDYYALHIRRGDLQFKEVKIGASEMLQALQNPNGTAIIPPGSLVYLSTDDPKGICDGCKVNRQPCDSYPKGNKPVGCPEDVSYVW